MTISVPQVSHITVDMLRHKLGELLELSLEYYKYSGNLEYLKVTVNELRGSYESEFKEAANLKKMDRDLCDKIGKGIDRLQSIIEKAEIKLNETK